MFNDITLYIPDEDTGTSTPLDFPVLPDVTSRATKVREVDAGQGPSFLALYEDKHNRDRYESANWWTRETPGIDSSWLAFADVFIDFRLPAWRHRLPPIPKETDVTWPSLIPDWSMDGWNVQIRKHVEGDTWQSVGENYLRITDADGFRLLIAVSQPSTKTTGRFVTGRFSFLLPNMKPFFQGWRNATAMHASSRTLHSAVEDRSVCALREEFAPSTPESQRYDVHTLMAAVKDPRAWFGTSDWSTLGTGRVSPARLLLAWANAGYRWSADVEAWTLLGVDPVELALWKTPVVHPKPGAEPGSDDTESFAWSDDMIREWFPTVGSGNAQRAKAMRYVKAGLTTQQYLHWDSLFGPSSHNVSLLEWVRELDEAGHTVDEVVAVRDVVKKYLYPHRAWSSSVSEASVWGDTRRWWGISPHRAALYIAAGETAEEAAKQEGSPETAPSDEALKTLAQLLTGATSSFAF